MVRSLGVDFFWNTWESWCENHESLDILWLVVIFPSMTLRDRNYQVQIIWLPACHLLSLFDKLYLRLPD